MQAGRLLEFKMFTSYRTQSLVPRIARCINGASSHIFATESRMDSWPTSFFTYLRAEDSLTAHPILLQIKQLRVDLRLIPTLPAMHCLSPGFRRKFGVSSRGGRK